MLTTLSSNMRQRCVVSAGASGARGTRDETDSLPPETICLILRFLSLSEAAIAARVCKKWHTASRYCESLATSSVYFVKTRWARVANEEMRAAVELRFGRVEGELCLHVSADVSTVRVVKNDVSDFELTPLCTMNTMPWVGHRVGPYKAQGGGKWPSGSDEALPGRTCTSKPLQASTNFTGSLALTNGSSSDRCTLQVASDANHRCQGLIVGTLESPDGQLADIQVMSTHLRLTVRRATRRRVSVPLDCFAGDDPRDFALLARVLEEISVPRPLRSSLQITGHWGWTTDVRPIVIMDLEQLDAARGHLSLTRRSLVEAALYDAGCTWNTVDTLRDVDFFCKEVLRHRQALAPDLVAEQLGFTAHRHFFPLDVKEITTRVIAAETRFEEAMCVADVLREQLGAFADTASLIRALASRDDQPVVQEIVLSLAWADRCGARCPWGAPPRPEVTGVACPFALRGKLSDSQVLEYTGSVLGEKSRCACALRGFARPPLY